MRVSKGKYYPERDFPIWLTLDNLALLGNKCQAVAYSHRISDVNFNILPRH